MSRRRPWYLVPCLVQLRAEMNQVAPGRDLGADGSVADRRHYAAGSSKHIPDARGRVLALDIDSTGPWPAEDPFDELVEHVRQNHRDGQDNRLQNIIWRGRIASRSWGWTWRPYVGPSKHFDHAHFEARTEDRYADDESGYGLHRPPPIPEKTTTTQEEPVQDELVPLTDACAKRLGYPAGTKLKLSLLLQYAIIFSADALAEIKEHDAGTVAGR